MGRLSQWLGPKGAARQFGCAIAVLSVLIVAAAWTPVRAGAPRTILFVNPGFADQGFWQAVSKTMRAAAEDFGYEIKMVSGDRKWPLMISRGLAAIEEGGADYIVLVNEHQQAPVLMEAASRKGTPFLLLLNGLAPEQSARYGEPGQQFAHWIGDLTPDNEIAGYQMARSLAEAGARLGLAEGEPLSILSLAGDYQTPASINRLKGLDRALAEDPALSEVRRMTVNWSEEEAYQRTRISLQGDPPRAVWAANDPIALGAIRAYQEIGLEPGRDVAVAGLNWSREAVERVARGEMTLTHGGHFLAGAWIVVLIHDLDTGLISPNEIRHVSFPMSAITAANAERYLTAFGDGDWSKIDFAQFSKAADPTGYHFTLDGLFAATPPHAVKD